MERFGTGALGPSVTTILNSIADGVLAVDAAWHFTYINGPGERLARRARGEVLGRPYWEVFPQLVGTQFETEARRAAAERVAVGFDAFCPAYATWFQVRMAPSPAGLVITFQDITARKQAEAEREDLLARERAARAAAEQAARARQAFLAIAAHELRTPLTTIKGNAQLFADLVRQPSLDRDRLTRFAAQFLRQVTRLETLVNDLLDVSRIQHGRLELRLEPVDLADLAKQALAHFQHSPHRTPRHTLALDAPAPVVGTYDPARLDQVLANLLSNALKYSPEGGEIRVGVRREQDQAVISVSDQGMGIAPAEQAQLFKPFARGTASQRGIQGMGLGLYLTRQIVERHGGTIGLRSEPGVGSIFTVRLPLRPIA